MKKYELKDVDSEDLEDLLSNVETSFGIAFVENELAHITTFGELCDYISNKIQLEEATDCTSQQAFYKLRKAISSALDIDPKQISTDLSLVELLPRKSRRARISKIEHNLGFKLNILGVSQWMAGILIILLVASLIELFSNKWYGLLGIIFSIVLFRFAFITANELNYKTVGEVAEKMSRENYLKSRRNPNTVNKNEIEKALTDWFSDNFGLEKSELSRDAKFYKE